MACATCTAIHEHVNNNSRISNRLIRWMVRVAVTLAAAGAALALERSSAVPAALPAALFVAAYLAIAYDVLLRAGRNILRGSVFDENFLMVVATIGAFLIGEYPEAVAVMLFYQIGETLQDHAVDSSRRSIAGLMDIRPDAATVLRAGEELRLHPSEVAPGERIVVRPGERIPLDGTVQEGRAAVDTSALTGESVPRELRPGDRALSGSVNTNGVLTILTDRSFGESTASKILDLVEHAADKKAKMENFITAFARWYTPAVVGAAALLAVLPPLLVPGESFSVWTYRALVFLVASCPCALVLSIPLSFFAGIGAASRAGILIKGGNYLEALAKTGAVVFDKTGTLTEGVFKVSMVHPADGESDPLTESELLALAAHTELFSTHPISRSLMEAHRAARSVEEDCCRSAELRDIQEIAGKGIRAVLDGVAVLAGNAALMEEQGIRGFAEAVVCRDCAAACTVHADGCDGNCTEACRPGSLMGTVVHVAAEGRYAGHIVISDEIKADAAAAVAGLAELGIGDTVMLTGDREENGRAVAEAVGVARVYAELLPADKVRIVEDLLRGMDRGKKLAFVGDGINDAPVLARSDVGVAMGGLGSDAAIEAADVVIMNDRPSRLPQAIRIARKTMAIVAQNIVLALGIKGAVLLLSASGYAVMWAAVFADVGVALLATANALRITGKRVK